MTFHTGQQASNAMQCNANHEAPPAESSKRSPLSRNMGRPLTGIVLNLTLPKLHLATFRTFLFWRQKCLVERLKQIEIVTVQDSSKSTGISSKIEGENMMEKRLRVFCAHSHIFP